jgi:hypothetical protein
MQTSYTAYLEDGVITPENFEFPKFGRYRLKIYFDEMPKESVEKENSEEAGATTKEWLQQWYAELDAIDEKLDPADFPRMEWGREIPVLEEE